jgi:TonB family protein
MNASIPYPLQSAIIVAALYAYYHVGARGCTFHGLNRAYLLCSVALAVALPLIRVTITTVVTAPVAVDPLVTTTASDGTALHAPAGGLSLAAWIYLAGVAALLAHRLHSLALLALLARRHPRHRFHGLRVVKLPRRYPVGSFFNTLFINDTIAGPRERREIFAHEKIHARGYHSADRVLVDLFCLFNWFNPFAWWLKSALTRTHEYIADRQVTRQHDTGDYLQLLVKQAFNSRSPLVNYLSCTNLKKRVIMMTKNQTPARGKLRYLPALLLCGVLFTSFSLRENVVLVAPEQAPQVTRDTTDDDVVYEVVTTSPEFPGGFRALMSHLRTAIRYPAEAEKKGLKGKVFVQFIVGKDGTIRDAKLLRSIDPLLDEEALRVVKAMPKWIPGQDKGKPVSVRFTLPISFTLQNDSTPPPPAGK